MAWRESMQKPKRVALAHSSTLRREPNTSIAGSR
jgi:hypothetical protein